MAADNKLRFKSAVRAGLPYRFHEPVLAPGATAPLVVFLHGAGERGSDDGAQLSYPFFEAAGSLFAAEPSFILAPQIPSSEKWIAIETWSQPQYTFAEAPTPSMAKLLELVNEWRTHEGVDPARIYATGLSMGGYATYDILARKPEWFAAAFIVCGRGDPATAVRMKGVPIYAVHGEKDTLIPPALARQMVEALTKAGGQVTYAEYTGVGHDAWHRGYSDAAVRAWLFRQKRMP